RHYRQDYRHQHGGHSAGRDRHRYSRGRNTDDHGVAGDAGPGHDDGGDGGHGEDLYRQRQQLDSADHHHGADRGGALQRRHHLFEHGDTDADGGHGGQHDDQCPHQRRRGRGRRQRGHQRNQHGRHHAERDRDRHGQRRSDD